MKNEPTTKPTEVRPSWSPYSNSVAPRTLIENGSSRTFHRPNEKNMNAPTMNSERMTGVPNSVAMPGLEVGDDDRARWRPRPASASGSGPSARCSRPQNRNDDRIDDERPGAGRPCSASSPAPANPIAVEPNDAIDRNELAAASSSSLASSGIRLSWAGSKNCLTPALSSSSRYRPGKAIASIPMTTAMQADDDRLDQAGHDHDRLAVVAIDVDAGQQADDEARDGRHHQGQADRQGGLGLAIDVDPGRQVGQRRAGGRDQLGRATAARSRAAGRPRTWTGRARPRRSSILQRRPRGRSWAESSRSCSATVTPSRSSRSRLIARRPRRSPRHRRRSRRSCRRRR